MLANILDTGRLCILLFRISAWFQHKPFRPCRWVAFFLYRLNLFLTGADIPPTVQIGQNFKIPHPVGVVIGRKTIIGNSVKIMSGVVFGSPDAYLDEFGEMFPILNDHVFVGANSVVLGNITLGPYTIVGAGSVVTKSYTEGYAMIGGNPAIKIKDYSPDFQVQV
ncbi:MAG: hypothetical protein AB1401_02990 [Thermodesulfobacteriota bacterium]